jgi:hypothetical protein
VPAHTVDAMTLHLARRQHVNAADRLAQQAASCLHAVRQDLAHDRPAGAAARKAHDSIQALLEALAELRAVERMASYARKPAA